MSGVTQKAVQGEELEVEGSGGGGVLFNKSVRSGVSRWFPRQSVGAEQDAQ